MEQVKLLCFVLLCYYAAASARFESYVSVFRQVDHSCFITQSQAVPVVSRLKVAAAQQVPSIVVTSLGRRCSSEEVVGIIRQTGPPSTPACDLISSHPVRSSHSPSFLIRFILCALRRLNSSHSCKIIAFLVGICAKT